MLIGMYGKMCVPSAPVCLGFITLRRHTFYKQKCTQKVEWISVIHYALKKSFTKISTTVNCNTEFFVGK